MPEDVARQFAPSGIITDQETLLRVDQTGTAYKVDLLSVVGEQKASLVPLNSEKKGDVPGSLVNDRSVWQFSLDGMAVSGLVLIFPDLEVYEAVNSGSCPRAFGCTEYEEGDILLKYFQRGGDPKSWVIPIPRKDAAKFLNLPAVDSNCAPSGPECNPNR